MGLLDKWQSYKEGQTSKKISKNLKLIKNPKAIKEDRNVAIEFFCELKDPTQAAPALLARFEYSLEHGINDTREKETCLEALVKLGAPALPYIREHIKNTNRIAWPIKALNKLSSEKETVEALKDCLIFEDISFDQAKLDKNYDILCYLVDYQLGDFTKRLYKFLEEHDERIRFATIELLLEQELEEIPLAVERFITDTSAENTRLRQAVIAKFAEKSWKVKDADKIQEVGLQRGFRLQQDNTIVRV